MAAQHPVRQRTTRKVYVSKPGTLSEMLTRAEADRVTTLYLQGKLNAVDFQCLRDSFKNLTVLDISTAAISSYAGKNGPCDDRFTVYHANSIPAYAFCKRVNDSTYVGKSSLVRVILSDKTKNICEGAFKGCTGLRICQIRRKMPPRLLGDALADSISAVFVPEGCVDAYRQGKQWDRFAFIEGEPVGAMLHVGPKSSLASELMRKGLKPEEVNFLSVEGKLDEADFELIRNQMPKLVTVDLSRSTAAVIPDYTFSHKRDLLKVVLPEKLRAIGQRAFSGCSRLGGTLQLPPSVTTIEYGAFMDCANLSRVL
ncbi:MAG: leucine-rich repeat domain-containing protein, partial [Prevotellaceae bacterium]|nr:leucine-rich repeat domain-containing protein [Prevotellaceae bacterium]